MERTLLIIPTPSCNLRCGYCYITNKTSLTMQREMVSLLASRIQEHLQQNPDDRITCLWHGGEPSLMPLSFWEYVEAEFAHIDPNRISKGVQTNLTNDIKIYKWFVEHSYKVSSSLDGDFLLHSKGRNTTKRQYNRLLENIKQVKEWQGTIGVVCVVSSFHLRHPVELVDFFEDMELNVRFNMVEAKTWPYRISYSEYYSFLIEIARTWLWRENSKIDIEPISLDVAHLLGDFSTSTCERTPDCYTSFLAIYADGSIYPCTRFTQHPAWRYGHLREHPLSYYWDKARTFFDPLLKSALKDCAECKWQKYCAGGCKYQRVMEDSLEKANFCKSTKTYFEELTRMLQEKALESRK